MNLDSSIKLDRYQTHDIELVVDRLTVNEKNKIRLKESLKISLELGDGVVMILEIRIRKLDIYQKTFNVSTNWNCI